MKNEPDKVWVTVSETVNMGNYESIKIEAGYSMSYSKEDPKELLSGEIDSMREIVEKKANKIRKKLKKR